MEIVKSQSEINKMKNSQEEFINRLELAKERNRKTQDTSVENMQSKEHRGEKRIKKY